MESLERFTQNQLIIEEYVSQWLAAIPSDFGRLVDVATLRDVTSGHYHHPALKRSIPNRPSIRLCCTVTRSSSRKLLVRRGISRSGIYARISPEWMLRLQKLPRAGSKSNIFVASCLWVLRRICAICFYRTLELSSSVSSANRLRWQPQPRTARLRIFAIRLSDSR